MFERPVTNHYEDPVDSIWTRAANDLGLTIHRSADAFAAYDGKGTLTIADASHFDADDCLAQMIFHEICHWLVAGKRGDSLDDWGLSNVDDRDLVYEYAAHRVQAALAHPFGLRDFMAVTTDWRPYWDALPDNPLLDDGDPATPIAREGFYLAQSEPFKSVLDRSLAATAVIADAVRGIAGDGSLWGLTRPRHRLGALLLNSNQQCGTCAWAIRKSKAKATDSETGDSKAEDERFRFSCRQHKEPGKAAPAVQPDEQACERWEPRFDEQECGSCGACCREGFDVLTVTRRDPFRTLHPELVQLRDDGQLCVPRPDGACVALEGCGSAESPYRCQHYETRPKNCGNFEVAGDACLIARRRVGLSR